MGLVLELLEQMSVPRPWFFSFFFFLNKKWFLFSLLLRPRSSFISGGFFFLFDHSAERKRKRNATPSGRTGSTFLFIFISFFLGVEFVSKKKNSKVKDEKNPIKNGHFDETSFPRGFPNFHSFFFIGFYCFF